MKALFQSKRLLFRPFTLNDADLLYDLNSDPEVTRYVHEPPTTKENAPSILKNIILPQYELKLGRWAMHLKDTKAFIGWAGLKFVSERDEIDLGYRFKRQYWGNGMPPKRHVPVSVMVLTTWGWSGSSRRRTWRIPLR
jgi:[ribosomal protein S5]-alanine N-acetyltransferase